MSYNHVLINTLRDKKIFLPLTPRQPFKREESLQATFNTLKSCLQPSSVFSSASFEENTGDKCGKCYKVLIVEDTFIAQRVASAILMALGCQISIAETGSEALALIEKEDFDLILMDIGLGFGLDGYEVTRQIRNRPNKIALTPIIALTAHGGGDNIQHCIDSGMNAVLAKPLTKVKAIEILEAFIPAKQDLPAKELLNTRKDLPDHDEELFEVSQFSILNTDQAIQNFDGDENFFIELLKSMLNDEIAIKTKQMKEAYQQDNFEQVGKLAHSLKGAAVYIGATRLRYACQYLERYWKAGERKLLAKLYEQILTVLEDTEKYIVQWLKIFKGC